TRTTSAACRCRGTSRPHATRNGQMGCHRVTYAGVPHMHAVEGLTVEKLIPYSRFSGKRQEAGDSQRRQDALAGEAAREEKVPIAGTTPRGERAIAPSRGAKGRGGSGGMSRARGAGGVTPGGPTLCMEGVNRLSRQPWMEQVQLWKEILSRGIVIRT